MTRIQPTAELLGLAQCVGNTDLLVPHHHAWDGEVKNTDLLKEQLGKMRQGLCLWFMVCLVSACSQGQHLGLIPSQVAAGKTFAAFFVF